MSNENKLTILLILKDRVRFTYRWLEYYKNNLSYYQLIIADGSINNSLEKYVKKNYSDLNIDYKYYEPDTTLEKYSLKVIKALKEVNTEYVLQSSNDDFYSSSIIQENINFLEKNPQYCCSRSEIYDFTVDSFCEVSGTFKLSNKIYNEKCFNDDDDFNRVKSYTKNFNSLWHDISRTKAMLFSWESLHKNKIFFFPFQDIFLSFILVTFGKINRLQGIYMLHQNHQEMLARDKAYGTITEFINNGNLNHLGLIVDSIANEITIRNPNLDSQFIKKSFYRKFIENFILNAIKNEKILGVTFIKKFKINLKRVLSLNRFTYSILSLYRLLFKSKLVYQDDFINDVNIFVSKNKFLFSKDFKIK